jgi:nicotinate-nucleotide pyrophosphorylase (carboxylating)
LKPTPDEIAAQVAAALTEDLGTGDVSAALIDARTRARATLITRQPGTLAGRDWAEQAFVQLDDQCRIDWQTEDGEPVAAGQILCTIAGTARAMLTAERTALNFLQLLSGIATRTRAYVDAVADTGARILDTRKTLPGLRRAQKYAVTAGGGHNHRMGLHDMVMLKENHIAAAGSIGAAVARARKDWPTVTIEVEVETLQQLTEALAADVNRIMLDNFKLDAMAQAVEINKGRSILEASGGITLESVRIVAMTGVDDISVGELTKRITPLDLSLRLATLE